MQESPISILIRTHLLLRSPKYEGYVEPNFVRD